MGEDFIEASPTRVTDGCNGACRLSGRQDSLVELKNHPLKAPLRRAQDGHNIRCASLIAGLSCDPAQPLHYRHAFRSRPGQIYALPIAVTSALCRSLHVGGIVESERRQAGWSDGGQERRNDADRTSSSRRGKSALVAWAAARGGCVSFAEIVDEQQGRDAREKKCASKLDRLQAGGPGVGRPSRTRAAAVPSPLALPHIAQTRSG